MIKNILDNVKTLRITLLVLIIIFAIVCVSLGTSNYILSIQNATLANENASVGELSNRIGELEAQNSSLSAGNDSMQAQIDGLSYQHAALTAEYDALFAEYTELQQSYSILTNEKDKLEAENQSLRLSARESPVNDSSPNGQAAASSPEPSSDEDTGGSRTVYYTRTGSKYHYANPCGNGTYYPCTLEEAKSMGLGPCGKCVG